MDVQTVAQPGLTEVQKVGDQTLIPSDQLPHLLVAREVAVLILSTARSWFDDSSPMPIRRLLMRMTESGCAGRAASTI